MAGNLRIAKNALYLYTRTIVNMVVGIFTVQIMLDALGVDDYGLQAVAGCGTALFSFLIQVLGTSISRFITYELGRGDMKRLNETFNTAMVLFTGMGIFMAIVAETVGMYVLHHQLQVPEGRMWAAEWLIHFSALGAIVGMPQGPYGAVFTAHERFNVSAAVSLFGTFARLGILLLVRESGFDHLILYTVLMFVLSLGTMVFMRVYCIRNFPETKLHLMFRMDILRPMMGFSFWELFGSIGRTLKGTWYPMIINIYHGVRLNAAIGIGSTLSGAVTGMAFTVTGAFKPGIVKLFASHHIEDMKTAILTSTQLSMILYGVFAVPLLAQLDYVMLIWLKDVPELSRELCLLQLLINTVLMAYLVPAESLKSMGKNKGVNIMQIVETFLFTGGMSLVLFLGAPPIWACLTFELGILFNVVGTLWLVRRRLGNAFVMTLVRHSVIKVLFAEVAIYAILHLVSRVMGQSFITLVIVCALSVILFCVAAMTWLFDRQQREALRIFLRSYLPFMRTRAAV